MEFLGFSFDGIHSSRFNVYSIANGGKYSRQLYSGFRDKTESIDGVDGSYFFGTDVNSKEFKIDCFVDGLSESNYRGLQNWLNPRKIAKLVFDEAPYKYYYVKVVSTPELVFIPEGDSYARFKYTGAFTINFIALDPYAYSFFNSIQEFNYDSEPDWYYDSGILYSEYTPSVSMVNVTQPQFITLYNGGNENAKVSVKAKGTWDSLIITNNTTNQSFTLSKNTNGLITINVNAEKGRTEVEGVLASSFHSGGYIELQGTNVIDYHLDISLTNNSNKAIINGIWENNVKDRYLFLNGKRYKITNRDNNTTITLNSVFTGGTGKYNGIIVDANEISIGGINLNLTKLDFEYKYTYL